MRIFIFMLIVPLVCSCATIVKGSKDAQFVFVSNVRPNKVVLKNNCTNTEEEVPVTDNDTLVVNLKARLKYFKRSKHEIIFFKSGFPPVNLELRPEITPWYWLNIPLGGIWMIAVDPLTGAMYQYKKRSYQVKF